MKTLTLKKKRIARQQALTNQLADLLKLTPDEMSEMMFTTACTYIEELSPLPEVAAEFLREPIFWNWWRQQWALVDEAFLHQASQTPLTIHTLRNWYEKMHREIDTFPDPVIYEQIHSNYMRMASRIIEKHTA